MDIKFFVETHQPVQFVKKMKVLITIVSSNINEVIRVVLGKMPPGKMPPGKMPPGKVPLRKLPPGNKPPRKIAPRKIAPLPLEKIFCKASSCYGIS